jgi:hypothetical protein
MANLKGLASVVSELWQASKRHDAVGHFLQWKRVS